MPAIHCVDLTKEYRTQKVVRALDHLSLEVAEGEVFGLLGPNGAGKTTLVRILATLLRVTSGNAQVCGYDVNRDEQAIRRLIGYAGQDSERSAYFRLTARQNLLYFAHALRGVPLRLARERIEAMAAALGFSDQLDKHFSTLSGGQKQLLIVLRALIHQPRVVFMDEPSKSLDPTTAACVRDLLLEQARTHGATIVLTTHNMPEAEAVCDRLAFINLGVLRFVGTPAAFRHSVTVQEIVEVAGVAEAAVRQRLRQLPGVRQVAGNDTLRLYSEDGFAVLGEVVALLQQASVKASVRMVEPSLEDAFSIHVHGGGEGNDHG